MIKKERYVITGIDQDTAPNERKQDSVYDAENIRIINNGRNLSVKPLKASVSYLSSFSATEVLLGSIELRNILYIFTHDTSSGLDYIAKIVPGTTPVRTNLLIDNLGFNVNYPIEVIANYENDNIIKLYWTDTINQLRFINVANPSAKINLVETIVLTQPTTELLTGGSLIAGDIQYVYNLYNINGSQSVLSTASSLISITQYMKGKGSGEPSNLSVKVSISSVDTSFEYIRVYSIHYQELNQTPKITLITDEAIGSSSFEFVDDGNSLVAELGTSELFSIGGIPIIVGTLAAKRNRLFVANYSSTNFDFDIDVRAFSHALSSNLYKVENTDGSDSALRTLPTVPSLTHDCINSDRSVYKYVVNSTTFGAEGVNIKVAVYQEPIVEGAPLINKSLKQNEVYRIGIRFFNTYGQATPAKWVSDIKIPEKEDLLGTSYISSLKVNLTTAGETIALAAGAVNYQLLCVERKAWDRTVLSQGFIVPGCTYIDDVGQLLSPYTYPYYISKHILDAADTTHPANIHKDYTALIDWMSTSTPVKNDKIMFFYSSDTMFESAMEEATSIKIRGILFDTIPYDSTKIVKFTNGAPDLTTVTPTFTTDTLNTLVGDPSFPPIILGQSNYPTGATVDTFGLFMLRYYNLFTPKNPTTVNDGIVDLETPSTFLPKGANKSINNTAISNYALFKDLGVANALFNTSSSYSCKFAGAVVLHFPGTTWHQSAAPNLPWGKFTTTQDGVGKLPIVELIREVPNQYGGASYEAKQRNTYMANGKYAPINTSQTTHYVGDTYVAPLVINRFDSEDVKEDKYWNIYEYVNLVALENNHNVTGRQDNLHDWSGGLSVTDNYQNYRIDDNHKLLSAFNQQPNFFLSFPKPVNYTTVNSFSNVVRASAEKFPNELIDSWTKFPVNDTRNLEGIYGNINKLYNFNGEVLVFQDTAIAVLSINPRIQTQATDGVNIELGIGAVLYDHKYISTNYGSNRKFSIIDNGKQLFYYDATNNTINVFADDKISTLLSIRNIMESNTTGVRYACYHRKMDDVIFIFDNYSVIFNSILQKFICKLTHEVSIENNHMLLGDKLLYKRTAGGVYEKYASTTYLPSSITYLFAPDATYEKVFHNLEYRLFGDNFDKILVTGNRNVSSTESVSISTKFDNHRIHLPRYSSSRERFREHSILVKLINDTTLTDYSLDDMVIVYNIKG